MAKDDGHKGRRIDGDGVCEGRQPEFPPMKRGFMSPRHCFEDGVRWSILCQFTSAHARHRRRNDCIHFRDYCCRSRVPPPCHVEPLSRQREMSFNRRDRECRFCTEIVIPRFPSDRLITLPRIAPNITLIQSPHLHRNGHLYVMHLLLQHSADPNLRDSQGFNTLHLATHSSGVMALLYMLHQPIAVDEKDTDGHTALMWAAWQGKLPPPFPVCCDCTS